MSTTPIPVIICGKIPSHQELVPKVLQPEYQVLKVFSSVEAFASGFSELSPKPAAVFMGGGFNQEEFDAAYAVPGASSIPWLRPIGTKPGNEHMMAQGPPPADVVAERAKKGLNEHVEVLKSGGGAGEIWWY